MKPSALPEGMTSATPDLLALREDFAAARGKPFGAFSVGELTAEVREAGGSSVVSDPAGRSGQHSLARLRRRAWPSQAPPTRPTGSSRLATAIL